MDHKLTIVSGKGGVGKTLVASALAQSCSSAGRKTILVSLDAHPHPVFRVTPQYKPQQVDDNLYLAYVDSHLALKEYVRRTMKLPLLYLPALENPAVAKFLDALPLFSEMLSLGKLYDLAGESSSFDSVVFDAPATGHCRLLLNVPQVAVDTLLAGPIYTNAKKILALLRDPQQTRLVIVTLAEEMPAREALELFKYARDDALIACDHMLVNRYIERQFTDDDLACLQRWTSQDPLTAPLYDTARFETEVANAQAIHLKWLRAQGLPISVLPQLAQTDAPLNLMRQLIERLPV